MAMATAFERTLGAFISTIEYCYFRYLNHNHYSNNMPKAKGRPLSLQNYDGAINGWVWLDLERYMHIYEVSGVDSVEVDLEMEKVMVVGYVDRNKVVKAVRRSGKRAEFWPNPNQPLHFTSDNDYFKDMTNDYKESYNYWRHGYNVGDKYGIIPVSHRGDDKVSNMFNDDNVNSCCLM
ncbi:hypothetical protein HHK36_029285 [Tetracentron sinense]|uniref:HMA domain-containing protein n=1 Tax=Tetracentron sinense TaxID=13715 RepID=A0A834YCZ7_TETSI|nr:hypothetical protein HHK36_029285 [Tetracentron sinense]